ncbi:Smr/MutS family protein [Falsiroseomonas sp. CW058]|uniref:Smr/MutS family protein n=1 Tax=Falsiroseomonas sp. CW058 TaxID=3388664 RepID=UPI003D318C4F
MPPRRKGLTKPDQALWRAYTADILPLFGHARPPDPDPPPPTPAPPAAPVVAHKHAPRPMHNPPVELRVGEQPGGLDHRRWKALRRGDLRAERTLDLHGRRANDAHLALRAFLHAAAADGVRHVTVVTGKGPAPEGGVLRRELPHWLNAPDLRPLVLGAAHPHPTNAGAVNILLRRKRAR